MQIISGIPITRYWLVSAERRPKMFMSHSTMSTEQLRQRTSVGRVLQFARIWRRSRCATTFKVRLAFLFISKLYRQMYASTGIATNSARVAPSARLARWLAKPCLRLFQASPMPELQNPRRQKTIPPPILRREDARSSTQGPRSLAIPHPNAC